ncbi:hypothetical protein G6O69_01720 [Pseudenhygromyxa sp. WMMC2535]|uniref:hypothetical protein n=1 Tax=Pseudenhygromyxa sp. WMMC2535 TaxID=2712867 RepID=UPI001555227C|nr:hypothetical protein [Pseudenhygromyxa sp. WMMC2535]NVB36532.1 hypothetical protein [Pseudenhygromyxa sp. WMMC2535]
MPQVTEGREDPTSAEHGAPELPQDGPSLKVILMIVSVVIVATGVLAYYRYARSERWVVQGIEAMDEAGKGLDAEGCIDAAIEWHDACDQEDTNAAVCFKGVDILMFHCLAAQDRSDTCELYLDPESEIHQATEDMRERARNPDKAGESGRWVYGRCEERGMRCINKRECACAEAYRAVDSFCRTGQQAVQL